MAAQFRGFLLCCQSKMASLRPDTFPGPLDCFRALCAVYLRKERFEFSDVETDGWMDRWLGR